MDHGRPRLEYAGECAFHSSDGKLETISVYSDDLGTLQVECRGIRMVGIRVGITVGELMTITGSSLEDIIQVRDVYHAHPMDMCFRLHKIPDVTFELKPSQNDLPIEEELLHGCLKWWEQRIHVLIEGIENNLVGFHGSWSDTICSSSDEYPSSGTESADSSTVEVDVDQATWG